jgi:hypothetical protein
LARNRLARQTKDSDGDYNALSATVSAAAQSAREFLAPLTSLKAGG